MVVDFSKLNLKERQTLILKNQDGTYIQPLVFAHNLEAKLCYNEVSEITFDVPAYVDCLRTPSYDEIVGMRLIDWYGIGQFILMDPSTTNDGIKEIKTCKAYSLEYELTFKQIFLEDGTYNFWNPVDSKNTVLGIILKLLPSWRVGAVDASLIGKYRTFEASNQSVYDFVKNTLQDTYQCIFDFDTYNRTINVHAVTELVDTKPVYLSLNNLIKEINVEEDTQNIFTCLDVNGADGVDIRSVNPMGTNKIYNLDYFMNTTYFSQAMIDKWNAWKTKYESSQRPYFNISIEKVMQEAKLAVEEAALADLKGELSKLEELQAVYAEAATKNIDGKSEDLTKVKEDITAKKSEITAKEKDIETIKNDIKAYGDQQVAMNEACAFESFFTDAELTLLDRYFKESSISDESFVYQTVSSYSDEDISKYPASVSLAIQDAKVVWTMAADGKEFYSITGGSLTLTTPDDNVSGEVVTAAFEVDDDGNNMFTAYLGKGTYGENTYPSGCISVYGVSTSVLSDAAETDGIDGDYKEGTYLTISSGESHLFFTYDTSEYAKRSVEWDLFEFGQENLEKLCWPMYTFSIEAANFLAMDEFTAFKNKFALGSKIYLDLGNGRVLSPIAVGAELNADDPTSFKLTFGDKYSLNDSAFKLVDLLEQAVSVGQTTASKLKNFNSFVESGASSEIYDYINSALNAAKNAVLAGQNQSTQIDGSGIRCRYYNPVTGEFDDEQIWIINNNIVFTDDNWDSAKMAIGKTTTEDGKDIWGIVAEALVGKMIAGNNLIIESFAADGTTVAFRVDGSGVQIHNGRFDLKSSNGQITLYPETGIVGGTATASAPLFAYDAHGNIIGLVAKDGSTYTKVTEIDFENLPRANFWVDMDGNAYFNGKIYAEDGVFGGELSAATGSFTGTVSADRFLIRNGDSYSDILEDGKIDGDYVDLMGINIVNDNGDTIITINDNGIKFTPAPDMQLGLSEEEVGDMIDEATPDVESILREDYNIRPISSTSIGGATIESPTIKGNNIHANEAFRIGSLGFLGSATGSKIVDDGFVDTITTFGVAMAAGDENKILTKTDDDETMITYDATGNYVIATEAGVRMTYNANGDPSKRHDITVTENGCYADGVLIGGALDGVATVYAVWG